MHRDPEVVYGERAVGAMASSTGSRRCRRTPPSAAGRVSRSARSSAIEPPIAVGGSDDFGLAAVLASGGNRDEKI